MLWLGGVLFQVVGMCEVKRVVWFEPILCFKVIEKFQSQSMLYIPMVSALLCSAFAVSKREGQVERTVASTGVRPSPAQPASSNTTSSSDSGTGARRPFKPSDTIMLKKVPPDLNDLAKMGAHFQKFGKVVNIEVSWFDACKTSAQWIWDVIVLIWGKCSGVFIGRDSHSIMSNPTGNRRKCIQIRLVCGIRCFNFCVASLKFGCALIL